MPTPSSTFEVCNTTTLTEITPDGTRIVKLTVPITCYALSDAQQVDTCDMIFQALTNGFGELERSRLEAAGA